MQTTRNQIKPFSVKGRKQEKSQVNLINHWRKSNYRFAWTRTLNQKIMWTRLKKPNKKQKRALAYKLQYRSYFILLNIESLNFSRASASVILSKRKIFFILHIKCKCCIIKPFICSSKYITFHLIIIVNNFSVQLTKKVNRWKWVDFPKVFCNT